VGHVTSFARLNLIGMGENMFLLTLVLAGIVSASQAHGNSNHLSGQFRNPWIGILGVPALFNGQNSSTARFYCT